MTDPHPAHPSVVDAEVLVSFYGDGDDASTRVHIRDGRAPWRIVGDLATEAARAHPPIAFLPHTFTAAYDETTDGCALLVWVLRAAGGAT